MEVFETKYFKTKETEVAEESVMKASFSVAVDSFSPRDPNFQSNLGTIVMKPWGRNASGLGDIQTDDWREYFMNELSDKETFSSEYNMKIQLPTVEECRANPNLERYIVGNEANGFYFDKPLFVQDMEATLSQIREENEELIDEIDCGIEIDESNQTSLKDEMFFTLKTTEQSSEYNEAAGRDSIIREMTSFIDENKIKIIEENTIQNSSFDNKTDYELFQMWNEKNLVCIPITGYEHSEITLHAGKEGIIAHKQVHEKYQYGGSYDNDEIKEDGFIFVEKDAKEIQNELKGEARDKDGNVYNKWKPKSLEEAKEWAKGILTAEVEEYARWVEGNVYDVLFEKLNPATLEWEEYERVANLCKDNLDGWISGWASTDKMLLSKFITKDEAEKLATTITPEYKESSWNKFLSEIKKELPNFDGKAEYASAAVLYAMNKNGSITLEKEALKQVMSEKGFSSKEKTIELLNKELGLSEKTIKSKKNVLKEREM